MEENYDDVHKGRVIHKMYGKQVGGTVTLKPMCQQGQMLAQQPAQRSSQDRTARGQIPWTGAFAVMQG